MSLKTLQRKNHWTNVLTYFILVVVIASLFRQTVDHGYNLDDNLVTIDNERTVNGLSKIPEIFSEPFYSDDQGYSYEYRPVTLLSFALEHEFFELNPSVSHAINILLFTFIILSVHFLLTSIFGLSRWASLIGTIFIIAHPANVEVVASIKNRDELLAISFAILSVVVLQLKTHNIITWTLVTFLLAASLYSKLSGIPIVGLAFLVFIQTENHLKYRLLLGCVIGSLLVFLQTKRTNAGFIESIWILLLFILPALVLFNNRLTQFTRDIYTTFRFKFVPDIQDLKKRFLLEISPMHTLLLLSFSSLISFQHPQGHILNFLAILSCALSKARMNIFTIILISVTLTTSYLSFIPLAIMLLSLLFAYQYTSIRRIIGLMAILNAILLGILAYTAGTNMLAEVVFLAIVGILSFIRKTPIRFRFKLLISFLAPLFSIMNADIIITLITCVGLPTFFFVIHKVNFRNESILRFQHMRYLMILLSVIIVASDHDRVSLSVQQNINEIESLFHLNDSNCTTEFGYPCDRPFPSLRDDKWNRPVDFVESPLNPSADAVQTVGFSISLIRNYLMKLIIPTTQSFYYGYNTIRMYSVLDPLNLVLLVSVFGISMCVLWRKTNLTVRFGSGLILLAALTYSNIPETVIGLFSDRTLFVATIGLAILVATMLNSIFSFNKNLYSISSITLMVILLIPLFNKANARAHLWEDDIQLMKSDLIKTPNSAHGHYLLGHRLMQRAVASNLTEERTMLAEDAHSHFTQSVTLYPVYFNGWYYLSECCSFLGRYDEAETALENTLELDPDFTEGQYKLADLLFRNNEFLRASIIYESLSQKVVSKISVYEILIFAYQGLHDMHNMNRVAKSLQSIDVDNQTAQQALRVNSTNDESKPSP